MAAVGGMLSDCGAGEVVVAIVAAEAGLVAGDAAR